MEELSERFRGQQFKAVGVNFAAKNHEEYMKPIEDACKGLLVQVGNTNTLLLGFHYLEYMIYFANSLNIVFLNAGYVVTGPFFKGDIEVTIQSFPAPFFHHEYFC